MSKRQVNYDSDKSKTAQRLKEAMSKAGLNASQLAEKSKVNKASISQYCNAKQCPSNLSANAMGKVLKVDPLWLMGFDIFDEDEETVGQGAPKEHHKSSHTDLIYRAKLSEDEYDFIIEYRDLPQNHQKELKNFLNYLKITKEKYDKDNHTP